MKISANVKLGKPKGVAIVEHLRMENGKPVEVLSSNVESNVMMDQALNELVQIYAGTQGLVQIEDFLNYIRLSEDSSPVDRTRTALPGTTYIGTQTSPVTADEGQTGGILYASVERSSTFFNGAFSGKTFHKVFATGSSGLPSPVTEMLLSSPITITDGATEAIKITYKLYVPCFGIASFSNSEYYTAASGTVNLQEKVLTDPATNGASINWALIHKPVMYDFSQPSTTLRGTLGLQPDALEFGDRVYYTTSSDPMNASYKASANHSLTVSRTQNSTTNATISVSIKFGPYGNVGTSLNIWGLLFGNANSPFRLQFDQAINVDWRQSLSIDIDITFDWT